MTTNTDLAAEFLGDHEGPIPWQLPEGGRGTFETSNLFLGQGPNGLEVAVASSKSRPNASDVRQLWKRRKGNRPAPLLLVVVYSADGESRTTACGPVGDDPPVYADRDPGQIERIAAAALTEPNRNAAIRLLHQARRRRTSTTEVVSRFPMLMALPLSAMLSRLSRLGNLLPIGPSTDTSCLPTKPAVKNYWMVFWRSLRLRARFSARG